MPYTHYILSSFPEKKLEPAGHTRTYSVPKLIRTMSTTLSRTGNRSFQKVGIGRARTKMSVIRLVVENASDLAAWSVHFSGVVNVDSQ